MNTNWQRRIPELDGIRAIAIWMVLAVHIQAGYDNAPGALSFLPRPVRLIFGHGWLGVDLFFVLSGFLITGILLDSKSRPGYFRNFYIRRFLRIMPLYFAVVIVWSVCYRGYASYFFMSSLFGANLAPLLHVHAPHGPGVLWSLAVEEHFYLLWPTIVFLLEKRKLTILCASIFLLSPILRSYYAAHGTDSEVIYNLSWFRFDGLALGAALALYVRSRFLGLRHAKYLAGLSLLALLILTVAGSKFGLGGSRTVAAVGLRYTQAYLAFAAFFLAVLAYLDTSWTAWLRLPFFQLTGALSYCLYLVHLSVGDLYNTLFGHVLKLGPSATVLARGAFLIVVSYAIAFLARRYVEAPCLALKDRFTFVPITKTRPAIASGEPV